MHKTAMMTCYKIVYTQWYTIYYIYTIYLLQNNIYSVIPDWARGKKRKLFGPVSICLHVHPFIYLCTGMSF